ncbi:hypothetical protein [Barnesiella sp. An55]|uniref:hypothetical protein n=1 Tax=Barnesiella sp. An55 TaxID=1965646 RepID=UPI000B3A9E5B|nr:hypothetical protein [Barnesiella sp. An55]OUN71940.1 hypothetical protein B5G10_08525 [Barnesiella sp. An55]HIZ26476.1 hypothetical protein [Candidatus Barnesiella merdipullorum]
MKRSTIVLLIVLAVMIFTPIIAIKIISNLSPETKLKSLKELLDYNENYNAPVRYLVIDDTDNDSVYSCIFISTRDKKDSRQGIVFANGENYTGDTLHITDQWLEQPAADDSNDSIPQSWFGKQTLDYDHNTRLIVENHNPNVTLYFSEGNFDKLIVQSQGDVVVRESNVGMLVMQDSIGHSGTTCQQCNIGTLFAYLNNTCSLSLSNNNIGTAFLPKALNTLALEGNNIGVTGSTDLIEFNLSKSIGNDSIDTVSFGIGVKYSSDDKADKKEKK